MFSPRLLSALAQVLLSVILVNYSGLSTSMCSAPCIGADPCHACKNCKYCKHCAKEGGKWGVCK